MKSKITIEDFIELYKKEKPMYEAWGNCVKSSIVKSLLEKEYDLDKLIKIPIKPRVKDIDSIVDKAFIRKTYNDPYNDITDKVGIRIVVLLESQIEKIKEIIEATELWDCSEDVDYVKNKQMNPELFTYQSVHYIVRNKNNINFDEYTIKRGTPCEIQVRTLEQHAYAEISHDMVYKKNVNIDSEIKRYLARSMALNEATDDLFVRVYELMEKEKENYYNFTNSFMALYTFKELGVKTNKSLYDMVESIIKKHEITVEQVMSFINSKSFITDRIKEKESRYLLYRQPMIYLIYYLAKYHGKELEENWELTEDLLIPIFSDLGISFGEY